LKHRQAAEFFLICHTNCRLAGQRWNLRLHTPLTSIQQAGGSREKIHLTKQMIDEMLQGEVLRSLTGLLHTEISAEEIRAERLKKHDHIA
jgi:hypothetical protein